MKNISLFVLIALPLNTFAGNKVIYGDDNRNEVYNYPDRAIQDLALSTVALVKKSNLTYRNDTHTILQETLSLSSNACFSERFSSQPTAAFCSGFLIAPNKIVTAGHCITSDTSCSETRFIFDYKMKNDVDAEASFSPSQVYSCQKILGRIETRTGLDYAVIELDRSVDDRQPLKLSTNKDLKAGTEIFVIGNPSGLPTKITDSAKVRSINPSGFFVANLDTYGGNSGSAVFNAKTLEVEGILVRGERDYMNSSGCNVSYRVGNDEGRGEDVTLISEIREGTDAPPVSTAPLSGMRYVWLESDQSCNEFYGNSYVREVADLICPDAPVNRNPAAMRYVWLSSNSTCNEFHNTSFIRVVSAHYCHR